MNNSFKTISNVVSQLFSSVTAGASHAAEKEAGKTGLFEKSPVYRNSINFLFFAPGMFFVLIALAAVLAPRLVLAIVAGFFLFLGAAFCFVAWKFVQLRRKFHEFTQKFQGRVIIQGVDLKNLVDLPSETEQQESIDQKKIIVH